MRCQLKFSIALDARALDMSIAGYYLIIKGVIPKLSHSFLAHLTCWCPRLCIAAQCEATRPPANMRSREWREGVSEVRLASPGPENQEQIKVNQEENKVNQGKSSSNKH